MREHLRAYTLLYAEDENKVQAKMAEYFESYFKTVYCVSDGQEALELYKRHLPDVVILDINMPRINGLEVARRIRKNDIKTRIIMMSAHSERELLLQATEIDMSRYLIKPVAPFDLKQALDKVASELISTSTQLTENSFNYSIDKKGLIYKNNILLNLSKSQRRVLALLLKNIGFTVGYDTFYYGEEGNAETNNEVSLRNTMAKLRKKCPDLIIKNIKGMGYIANTI